MYKGTGTHSREKKGKTIRKRCLNEKGGYNHCEGGGQFNRGRERGSQPKPLPGGVIARSEGKKGVEG